MRTANYASASKSTLLTQESCKLSQTLKRIEALCESSDRRQDLGQAQEMITLLQRRIERLRRLNHAMQAS